jgi:hypothetical protein
MMPNHMPDQDLIPDIQKFIQKYVALPSKNEALVLATWVLHTWNFGAANVTPYLYIYSFKPSSGKSTLLETLQVIARNARRADDMTAPVMFKIIERECPTLLMDEIDTQWSGSRNEPKRNVLNTGYRKGGVAWREQARELIEFSTFCAKVLCGINNGFLPATIRDRCIPIELKPKASDQKIERFVMHRVMQSADLNDLLDRIELFGNRHFADIHVQSPKPMANVAPRQDEISEPLLAIAAVLGYEDELRTALERIFATAGKTQPSPTQVIFRRIHEAFEGQPKIWTDDLCKALGPMYNGRTLALWLEPFGIMPKDVRVGNQVKRGYSADQFMQVWEAHLGLKNFEDDSENFSEVDEESEAA